MKKSLIAMFLVALACVASGCDSWLEPDPTDNNITLITQNVDFEAQSATCKRFSGALINFPERENFVIELLGKEGSVRDAMILDLLTPKGAELPVGKFPVGQADEYMALSRYDIMDSATGLFYMGGSYYGRVTDGFIKDYYGFLTEGEVNITLSEEGIYTIVVDAKSSNYTIKVRYEGEMTIIRPEEKK